MTLTTLELCAGAGGQTIGLRRAGFRQTALIDNDEHAYQTLHRNVLKARVICFGTPGHVVTGTPA